MFASTDFAFNVQGVTFSYGQIDAVRNVSLQIRRGERIALLGANGSGKSTLLRLLAGLLFPETGSIRFFGEPLSESQLKQEDFFLRFRRTAGLVFQNPDVQLFNASVFDEVAFGPLQLEWPRARVTEQVQQTLRSMSIEDLKERTPHRLSGGEKKRVALASVLVLDPDVLLLDEPTSSLDPNSQTRMIEFLASLKGTSKTVIAATHNLDALEDIADRCYLLESGSLAGEGSAMDILHDVQLLERTKLIRPHHHVHDTDTVHPHPHVHS